MNGIPGNGKIDDNDLLISGRLPIDPTYGTEPMNKPAIEFLEEEEPAEREMAEFPRELFPPTMRDIIHHFAKSKEAPYELAALPAIGVLSACLGKDFTVSAKGATAAPRIWMVAVAPPGSAKTPTAMPIIEPLSLIHQKELEHHNMRLAEWNRRRSEKRGKRQVDGLPDDDGSGRPIFEPAYTSDTNSAALFRDLGIVKRGLFYYLDELSVLSSVINATSEEGKAGRGRYLSAWSGSDIPVSRKTAEPIYIRRPFLSVYGSTANKGLAGLGLENVDGLAARFLWSRPKVLIGGLGDAVPSEVSKNWSRIVEKARTLQGTRVTLSGSSLYRIDELCRDSKTRARELSAAGLELLAGIASKAMEQFMRLLAFSHGVEVISHDLFGDGEPAIEDSIDKAFMALDYFTEHSRAVLSPFCVPDQAASTRSVTPRDLALAKRALSASQPGVEQVTSDYARDLSAMGVEVSSRTLGKLFSRLESLDAVVDGHRFVRCPQKRDGSYWFIAPVALGGITKHQMPHGERV